MTTIGTFTPAKDGGWTGSIHTLTINARLRLVPNDNRDTDKDPAFRVLLGNARIGDAWDAQTSGEPPKPYLRLRFDDPSLPEPLTAALFPTEGGDKAQRCPRKFRQGVKLSPLLRRTGTDGESDAQAVFG